MMETAKMDRSFQLRLSNQILLNNLCKENDNMENHRES